jgi:hypothetical protein
MQPGAQERAPFESADVPEGAEEGVLHGVTGVLFIAEDTPGND